METTKCITKEAVQAIQGLDFGEDTCNISHYIKKEWKTTTFLKIMSVKKIRHFTSCLQFAPALSAHNRFNGDKFFYAAKNLGQRQKLFD